MKTIILFSTLNVLLFSCIEQNTNSKLTAKKTISQHWLDSVIKQHSDSNYIKPYKRTDFVTATFYINKKGSSVCQIMKDSTNSIRQVIIEKNGTRSFFTQYYANGQLQADLPLDEFGQYNGTATYYNTDGIVESNGQYIHGLKTGEWKIFNTDGKLILIADYDTSGQIIKASKQ
jgi:antitoxin component YwqK of YwqJK toxin-antitoxin module